MRKTSVEAYSKIKASGVLPAMQDMVLEYIANHPNCTQPQASKSIPGAWKRFSELERMKLIEITGSKKEPRNSRGKIMYMRCNTYALTGKTVSKKECKVCGGVYKHIDSDGFCNYCRGKNGDK